MVRWLLLCVSLLSADESFITPQEYAAQLYHSPRGIGCHLCHGEKGEGRIIAHYKENGEKREFSAPGINQLSFDEFDRALTRRHKGMPRYYLTAGERKVLYHYLHPDMLDKENHVSK